MASLTLHICRCVAFAAIAQLSITLRCSTCNHVTLTTQGKCTALQKHACSSIFSFVRCKTKAEMLRVHITHSVAFCIVTVCVLGRTKTSAERATETNQSFKNALCTNERSVFVSEPANPPTACHLSSHRALLNSSRRPQRILALRSPRRTDRTASNARAGSPWPMSAHRTRVHDPRAAPAQLDPAFPRPVELAVWSRPGTRRPMGIKP